MQQQEVFFFGRGFVKRQAMGNQVGGGTLVIIEQDQQITPGECDANIAGCRDAVWRSALNSQIDTAFEACCKGVERFC